MDMINRVVITDGARKDLRRVPAAVADKLHAWVAAVSLVGLDEVRKIRGYDDHSLKGQRKGQRAIRLSLLWRAIYTFSLYRSTKSPRTSTEVHHEQEEEGRHGGRAEVF
jgi:hypothetical protein